jgi:bacterioferritin-associated ferredoxin
VWICLCEAVTCSVIRQVIDAGAESVRAIGEACGAGTDCGKCRHNIVVLLGERSARGEDGT